MMMNLSCDDRRGARGVMSVSLCTRTARSNSGGVAHFEMKREGGEAGSPRRGEGRILMDGSEATLGPECLQVLERRQRV